MKDWRECKKLSYKTKTIQVYGKPYKMKHWDFKPCHICKVEECRGKILIKAQDGALKSGEIERRL